MGPLVGFILIAVAAISIVAVMYFVLQEKHEHEDWYQPPAGEAGSQPEPHAPVERTVSETAGTEYIGSPAPERSTERAEQP
jgi:hypothetical protein